MQGQRIGYVRVSSTGQNPERQLENVQIDRKFVDTASSKNTQRPQLEEMMKYVRAGDVLIIHSMDRLARNLDDLRQIVVQLTKRGVRIDFLKEGLSFTGEDSPMAILLLSVMGAFAVFERALIRERQREGILLAKKKGLFRGRKKSLSHTQVSQILQKIQSGEKKTQVAKEFNISRETLYQYLRDEKRLMNKIEQ